MNIEEIRDYCILKAGVTESFPFDETTLVFKVMGKIFCLMNLDGETGILLKNTPEKVMEMLETYSCVFPGYHMNKVHWIRVVVNLADSGQLIRRWIDESYDAVVNGLPGNLKNELNLLKTNDRI